MLTKKFGTLRKMWFYKNSSQSGNWCLSIPPAQMLRSLDFFIGILNSIENNADSDVKYFSFPKEQNEQEAFKEFQYREIWRFGSYIVFLCNLDQVLERIYNDTLKNIKKFNIGAKKLSAIIKQCKKDELKKIKKYRNKIFAHTAFGCPKNDSSSMQLTTLDYVAGGVFGLSDKTGGVTFGGCWSGICNGEEKTFENMDFLKLVETSKKYIEDWHKDYEKLISILFSFPDSEIMSLNPEIKKIVRQ